MEVQGLIVDMAIMAMAILDGHATTPRNTEAATPTSRTSLELSLSVSLYCHDHDGILR